MSLTKILVAYDNSEYSRRALEWALALQGRIGVALDVVMVLPAMDSYFVYADYPTDVHSMRENSRTGMQEVMDKVRAACAERGHTVATHLLEGSIVETLLAHAKKIDADLVVTGTRGAGGFEGLLLGSVAHKLVTYAQMPVVVIK